MPVSFSHRRVGSSILASLSEAGGNDSPTRQVSPFPLTCQIWRLVSETRPRVPLMHDRSQVSATKKSQKPLKTQRLVDPLGHIPGPKSVLQIHIGTPLRCRLSNSISYHNPGNPTLSSPALWVFSYLPCTLLPYDLTPASPSPPARCLGHSGSRALRRSTRTFHVRRHIEPTPQAPCRRLLLQLCPVQVFRGLQ